MSRFYTTSIPTFENYSSTIPEMVFDSALKMDAKIQENYDKLDLYQSGLEAFKDYQEKDKDIVKERISYYNDKILEITENMNTNPLNVLQNEKEIKKLQKEIFKDTTSPEGVLYNVKKYYDSFQQGKAEWDKKLKESGNAYEDRLQYAYEMKKYDDNYINAQEAMKTGYNPLSTYTNIDTYTPLSEIVDGIKESSYANEKQFFTLLGAEVNKGKTSKGVSEKKIHDAIHAKIKSNLNLQEMYDYKAKITGSKIEDLINNDITALVEQKSYTNVTEKNKSELTVITDKKGKMKLVYDLGSTNNAKLYKEKYESEVKKCASTYFVKYDMNGNIIQFEPKLKSIEFDNDKIKPMYNSNPGNMIEVNVMELKRELDSKKDLYKTMSDTDKHVYDKKQELYNKLIVDFNKYVNNAEQDTNVINAMIWHVADANDATVKYKEVDDIKNE